MFWKKTSAEHKLETQPVASFSSDADQALDTIASLLKSFGSDAFDLEDVPSSQTRSECESWAQRLTLGEGKKDGEAQAEFRRDWGGVRRYFSAHRSKERDYVSRGFSNLRDAVQTFARCMATAVGEDKASDVEVGTRLGQLQSAFQNNDPVEIRKHAEAMAQVVKEAMDSRQQRQNAQFALLSDKIRKLRDELQQAREQAALDPLTQLHNRAALDTHLERVADLAFLLNSSPCLLMIDIDHFKSINDRFGHPMGDEVLRKVSDALVRQFLRREDFVARYGGEEFVVIIPDSTLQNAKKRADRVREAIAEVVVETVKGPLSVTISIGISCLGEGDSGKSWIARADAALYESKAGGRNRVSVSNFPLHSLASLRPDRG